MQNNSFHVTSFTLCFNLNTDNNSVKHSWSVFSFYMWENIFFYFQLLWPACTTEMNDAYMTKFLTTTYHLLDVLEILAYSVSMLEFWSKYYSQFTNETFES